MPVIAASVFDHRGRDIDAANLFEMRGECLSEPSDAASEVESGFLPAQRMDGLGVLEHCIDLHRSGAEEPLGVPSAIARFGARQNCPEWILAAERIPMLLEGAKDRKSVV